MSLNMWALLTIRAARKVLCIRISVLDTIHIAALQITLLEIAVKMNAKVKQDLDVTLDPMTL